MSATIVDYVSFKTRREQRPPEYFQYIDLLQEAYPELIRTECVEAVEQWFTEKDVLTERLWADCEYINCAIKVPLWENTVDKMRARFIPTGIVFRAALLSDRNLMMTFTYEFKDEDNDYYYVWHIGALAIGLIESLAVTMVLELQEDHPDEAKLDGILNHPYLYSEERLDYLRLSAARSNRTNTLMSMIARLKKKTSDISLAYEILTYDERDMFDGVNEFEEWWG